MCTQRAQLQKLHTPLRSPTGYALPFLCSYLALVEPGTLLQLYLGVAVSLCILILQLYAIPYRSTPDQFLSMVSASALVLTLLGSLGIQMINLKSELTTRGKNYTGLTEASLEIIIAVLVASALVVLLFAIGMFVNSILAERLDRLRQRRLVRQHEG